MSNIYCFCKSHKVSIALENIFFSRLHSVADGSLAVFLFHFNSGSVAWLWGSVLQKHAVKPTHLYWYSV